MTKLTDLNRANEALPAKNIRCPHQNINPKQLCYVCKCENDVVDSLGSVHLEVDVEAMAKIITEKSIVYSPKSVAKQLSLNIHQWARLVRK